MTEPTNPTPLRVAFVTEADLALGLQDPRRWVNPHLVTRFVASALEREGAEVRYISCALPHNETRSARMTRKAYRLLKRGRYLIDHHPASLRALGRRVASQLREQPADVVFCPSTIPVSQLDCDVPIVIWTDANFAGMIDYYPNYAGLCKRSIRQGHAMEQAALSRATRMVYTSNWAAQTARQAYDFDHDKLRILYRGANLEQHPTHEQAHRWIEERPTDRIELLFVGNDSKRKGGDVAIQVARCLHESGQPIRLRLLGQGIEGVPEDLADVVEPLGFVSKATQAGREQLSEIMSSSHLLLLPTRAECLSIVVLEACAFGVPTLGTRTGGVPEAITTDTTGQIFDLDTPPEQWAKYITDLFADPTRYQAMAKAAYQGFATKFNWTYVGNQLYQHLQDAAETGKSQP